MLRLAEEAHGKGINAKQNRQSKTDGFVAAFDCRLCPVALPRLGESVSFSTSWRLSSVTGHIHPFLLQRDDTRSFVPPSMQQKYGVRNKPAETTVRSTLTAFMLRKSSDKGKPLRRFPTLSLFSTTNYRNGRTYRK